MLEVTNAATVKAQIEANWKARGVASEILGDVVLAPNQQLGLPFPGQRLSLWLAVVAITPWGPLVRMEFGISALETDT